MNAKRLHFRFSLRELFVSLTLLSIPLMILAVNLRRVHVQRRVVAEILSAGGIVTYDYNAQSYDAHNVLESVRPGHYRRWFGDDFVSDVYIVRAPLETDDDSAGRFASLVELRELRLDGTRITDRGLAAFRPLSHMQQLYLDGTAISDQGLTSIHGMVELRCLSLGNTQITDQGIAQIRHLIDLERLDLRFTSVGDSCLAMLGGLAKLQWLDLSFTDVSDAEIDALSKLKNLRSLNLHGTNVSATGYQRLKASLPEDCHIQFAPAPSPAHRSAWESIVRAGGEVEYERLSDSSAEVTWRVNVASPGIIDSRILASLGELDNLRALRLNGCVLDDRVRTQIVNLPLRSIALQNITLVEADYELLSQLTDLRTIVLINCGVQDSDLVFLPQCAGLKELAVNGGGVSEATTRLFPRLSALEYIGLDGSGIDNAAIAHLSGCKNLKMLKLNNTSIDDIGLRSLHGLTNLRRLSVINTKVTSTGIAELQRALPQVKILSQSGQNW